MARSRGRLVPSASRMDTSADRVRDPVTMSIVIPSYQRRDSLLRLLASIDEALPDGCDTEVVIVLDGSTDGSSEALDLCTSVSN